MYAGIDESATQSVRGLELLAGLFITDMADYEYSKDCWWVLDADEPNEFDDLVMNSADDGLYALEDGEAIL